MAEEAEDETLAGLHGQDRSVSDAGELFEGGGEAEDAEAGAGTGGEVAGAQGSSEEASTGAAAESSADGPAGVEEVAEEVEAAEARSEPGLDMEMSFGELGKVSGPDDDDGAGATTSRQPPDEPLSMSLSFTLQHAGPATPGTPGAFRPSKVDEQQDDEGEALATLLPVKPVIVPTTLTFPVAVTAASTPTHMTAPATKAASNADPLAASSEQASAEGAGEQPLDGEAEGGKQDGSQGSGAEDEREPLPRAEESAMQDSVQTDYGSMPAPHALALQLLEHDLRTLPAYEEVDKAAVRQAAQPQLKPGIAQYGYLGLQAAGTGGAGAQVRAGSGQSVGERQASPGRASSAVPSASRLPTALRPSTAPVRHSSAYGPKRSSASAVEGALRNSRYPATSSASTHAARRPGSARPPLWRSDSLDEGGEAVPHLGLVYAPQGLRRSEGGGLHTTRSIGAMLAQQAVEAELQEECAPSSLGVDGSAGRQGRQQQGRASGSGVAPAPGWGRAEVANMSAAGSRDSGTTPWESYQSSKAERGAVGGQQRHRQLSQRPKSAGPTYHSGGGVGAGWPARNGAAGAYGSSGAAQGQRRAMLRPHSAQPASAAGSLAWESSWYEGGKGPSSGAANGKPTAAVSVGGQAVSVYVANTVARVLEANRWAAALGSARRYRLKSPTSNMLVQLVSGEAPGAAGPGGMAAAGAQGQGSGAGAAGMPPKPVRHGVTGGGGAEPVRVLKTMSLQQFLAAHADLRIRAAQAQVDSGYALGLQQQQQRRVGRASDGADGMPGRGRPWSAAAGGADRWNRSGGSGGVVVGWQSGSLDGSAGGKAQLQGQHSLYEVTAEGHGMVAAIEEQEAALQQVTAAAMRCQELAQQVHQLASMIEDFDSCE